MPGAHAAQSGPPPGSARAARAVNVSRCTPSPRAALEASLDARIAAAAAAAGGGDWLDGNDDESEEDRGVEDDGGPVDESNSKCRELAEQIEHMDFAVDKWEQQEIAWSSKLRHHAHSLSQLRRHMQESAQQRAENLGGGGRGGTGRRPVTGGALARRAVGETFAGGQGTRSRAPLKGHALDGGGKGQGKGGGGGGEGGGGAHRSAAGTQLSYDSDDLVTDLEMQALSLPGGHRQARALEAVGRQRSVEWDPVSRFGFRV